MKQFVLDLEKNMSYLDAVFEKAKMVNKFVAQFHNADGSLKFEADSDAGEAILPPKINEPDDCRYCNFAVLCRPDVSFGSPLKIDDNPVIEKAIDTLHLFDHFVKAHKKTNDFLKDACRGVDNVIVGKWHVTGKENKKGVWLKKFEIADELKMDEINRAEEKIKKLITERTSGNAETN